MMPPLVSALIACLASLFRSRISLGMENPHPTALRGGVGHCSSKASKRGDLEIE
jgi:hypothetical protein